LNNLNNKIYFNAVVSLAITTGIFLFLLFACFRGNISGFYRIGDTINKSSLLAGHDLIVFKGTTGYDGQQFLTLALDPFLLNAGTPQALDHPYYRAKRIMYPIFGYVLGAGSPTFILFSLVLVNVFCLGLLIWIGTLWFKHNAIDESWALGLLAIPSIWIILTMSTSELLCATFSLAALYYFQKERVAWSVLFVTLAIFTRETAILLLIVIFLSALIQKKFRYILSLSIPVILLIAWNSYLYFVLDQKDSGYLFSRHFSFPFNGITEKLHSFVHPNKMDLVYFFDIATFFLLIFIIIIGGITAIKNFRKHPELSLLFLIQAVSVTLFEITIFDKFIDYTRVCMEIYLYGFLMLPWSNKVASKIILLASICISIGYLIGFVLHSFPNRYILL